MEPLPIRVDAQQNYADELRDFASSFFGYFGASVRSVPAEPDLLHVQLTEALAEHFGKRELVVRFHRSARGESELIAFGSRLFDQMTSYLNRYGAVTLLRLPRRYAGGEELMRAVRPTNAGIASLKMAEGNQLVYAFNWHITYRADDKREELLTVVLDADGSYLGTDAAGDENDSLWARLLADAEPMPTLEDTNRGPAAPKLPPMTVLRARAEAARKYAIYHADLQCVEHERDVLPRLHTALSRLKTYYDQQIEEVYDTHDLDGEKRRILEEDLTRKNAEEIENHRLHVGIRLFSYALFELPSATAEFTLNDAQHSVNIRVFRNLYDGSLVRPRCFSCGNEVSEVALDHHGHLTCDDCIEQCSACQQIFCGTCGLATCPVCGIDNCEGCSVECWACGERACAHHVMRCQICGDTICAVCQLTCDACGRSACRSHMRVDAVSVGQTLSKGTGENGSGVQMICPDCAVRCPGCQQYSAQLGTCQASGQRFCTGCLAECVCCGRLVGVGFYTEHPLTGAAYCHACTDTCDRCGAVTTEQAACATCGVASCRTCGLVCEICREIFCSEHAPALPGCHHVVCLDHRTECSIGGEAVCPICRSGCAVCGRPYCEGHSSVCARCRREVCNECLRLSGLCDTCANHDRDGEFVTLLDEPCAQDERVAHLLPHYRWMRTRDRQHTLYIGRNRDMSAAIIVVQEGPDGGQVVLARRLGVLDSRYRERWI